MLVRILVKQWPSQVKLWFKRIFVIFWRTSLFCILLLHTGWNCILELLIALVVTVCRKICNVFFGTPPSFVSSCYRILVVALANSEVIQQVLRCCIFMFIRNAYRTSLFCILLLHTTDVKWCSKICKVFTAYYFCVAAFWCILECTLYNDTHHCWFNLVWLQVKW